MNFIACVGERGEISATPDILESSRRAGTLLHPDIAGQLNFFKCSFGSVQGIRCKS
jgi:hypothetical protein